MNKETELLKILLNKNTPMSSKVRMLFELENNPSIEPYMLVQKATEHGVRKADTSESGFYGNVWIRKQYYPTKATVHDGHTHNHDHMSLVKGRVLVEVEGYESKEFDNTFFTVAAEKHHKITALEDNTIVYCIFAVKDEDGKSADEYYAEGNTPYAEGSNLQMFGKN